MVNSKIHYISTADLARFLGVSDDTVLKRIKKGKIHAIKIGRSYAIPESAIRKHFPGYQGPTFEEGEYLSVMEAAGFLGISRVAVFNRIKKGKISAQRVGRHYVIPKDQILVARPDATTKASIQKDYVSVPELAEIMGVSRIYVFKQVQRGIIKAKKVGRHYAIAVSDITAPGSELKETKEKIPQEEYVSVIEAARILGISRIAVFKRIKKGQLEAIKIGRSFAVKREDVRLFLLGKKEGKR